uniref:Uncharacterized protein n=1 Tax=Strongyloides papillosus TaxID=174720 RepID=A0A0N5CGW1_STREA
MKEQFLNTSDNGDGSLTDYDNGDSDIDSTLMTSSNISNSDLQLSSMSNISNNSSNSQKISSLYYLNCYKNSSKPYRILTPQESQETIAIMTSQKKGLIKGGGRRSKSKPTNDRRNQLKEDSGKYHRRQ